MVQKASGYADKGEIVVRTPANDKSLIRSVSAATVLGLMLGALLGILPQQAFAVCGSTPDVVGTNASEFADGGTGNSTFFYMHGGFDSIEARDCRDDVYGQEDADSMSGAAGNDFMSGGDGADDPIFGGSDDDILEGNNGNDELSDTAAGSDHDELYGGQGQDGLRTGDNDGNDKADGGADSDFCASWDPNDNLISCAIIV